MQNRSEQMRVEKLVLTANGIGPAYHWVNLIRKEGGNKNPPPLPEKSSFILSVPSVIMTASPRNSY